MQRVAVAPAEAQLGVVAQDDQRLAACRWPDLPYARDVDEGRAVHAREAPAIEARLQTAQRLPQEMGAPAGVDLDVVVVGANPVDIADGDEGDARAVGYGDAVDRPRDAVRRCTSSATWPRCRCALARASAAAKRSSSKGLSR